MEVGDTGCRLERSLSRRCSKKVRSFSSSVSCLPARPLSGALKLSPPPPNPGQPQLLGTLQAALSQLPGLSPIREGPAWPRVFPVAPGRGLVSALRMWTMQIARPAAAGSRREARQPPPRGPGLPAPAAAEQNSRPLRPRGRRGGCPLPPRWCARGEGRTTIACPCNVCYFSPRRRPGAARTTDPLLRAR